MSLPDFQPSIIPLGEYVATIRGEIEEKTSQYDAAKTYYELQLNLKNSRGEHFKFVWNLSPKMPVYKNLLLLLGGTEQVSGIVNPPAGEYVGEKFACTIIERSARNDKNRLVNEVTKIGPYKVAEEEEGGEDNPF